MERTTEYCISAISSLLYNKPAEKIERAECEKMYGVLKNHGMSIMAGNFIRNNCPEYMTDEMKAEIALRTAHAIRQKQEYKKIINLFAERKIKYIPLKGVRLASIYPDNMVREMSDVDILIQEEDIEKITDIFEQSGYRHKHSGHHEVYEKDDICFEAHTSLIDEKRNNKLYDYFQDVWSSALRTENDYEYVLKTEDEYLYLLAHLYGHFHMGGCGIRYILDLYLFTKEHPDMNFEYIDSVLKKYKMQSFENNIANLAMVWFGRGRPNDITKELADFVMSSGTYGKASEYVLSVSEEKKSAISSVMYRKLFLSADEMKKRYPWIKVNIMLPLGYIYRGAEAIICKRKAINGVTKAIAKVDKKKIREYKNKMKRFGV